VPIPCKKKPINGRHPIKFCLNQLVQCITGGIRANVHDPACPGMVQFESKPVRSGKSFRLVQGLSCRYRQSCGVIAKQLIYAAHPFFLQNVLQFRGSFRDWHRPLGGGSGPETDADTA
jgi:hypothetical protein